MPGCKSAYGGLPACPPLSACCHMCFNLAGYVPLRRAPVRARYAPSCPGRCGSTDIMPTSGNRPMAVSGIANRVL